MPDVLLATGLKTSHQSGLNDRRKSTSTKTLHRRERDAPPPEVEQIASDEASSRSGGSEKSVVDPNAGSKSCAPSEEKTRPEREKRDRHHRDRHEELPRAHHSNGKSSRTNEARKQGDSIVTTAAVATIPRASLSTATSSTGKSTTCSKSRPLDQPFSIALKPVPMLRQSDINKLFNDDSF